MPTDNLSQSILTAEEIQIARILFDIWKEAKESTDEPWDIDFDALPDKHKREYYATAKRIIALTSKAKDEECFEKLATERKRLLEAIPCSAGQCFMHICEYEDAECENHFAGVYCKWWQALKQKELKDDTRS